jgi:hypothetical protein
MQNIITTGTESNVLQVEWESLGPQLHKWLFVIGASEFPDLFIETHTQESYEKRREQITAKGYAVACYNLTAIDAHDMLSLDEFLSHD